MYVRRPKMARWSAQLQTEVGDDTITVYDEPYIDTGIMDTDGTPICRVKDPIGFRRTGTD